MHDTIDAEEVLKVFMASQQQLQQAILALAQAMAAPKQVTLGDGRTITAQPVLQ